MTKDDLLVMLKSNLEIITDYMDTEAREAKDEELTFYIDSAERFIEREGITLSLDDIGDCQLIVMYAAWLYEKRKASTSYGNGVEMPRMLRWNLNNKLLEAKDA
jgi:hypothetical protein